MDWENFVNYVVGSDLPYNGTFNSAENAAIVMFDLARMAHDRK